MKKLYCLLVFSFFMIFSNVAYAVDAISLIVEDVSMTEELGTELVINNNRILAPLKVLEFLKTDMEISIDEENKKVLITDTFSKKTVQFEVDNKTAYKNGEAFEMDVVPIIIDQKYFIPLRYFSDAFDNITIHWDEQTNTISMKVITENDEDSDLSVNSKLSTFNIDDIDVIIPSNDALTNINVVPEDIDEEEIVSHLFGFDDIDEDDREELDYIKGNYSSKIYAYNKETVIIYPSGALIFETDCVGEDEFKLNKEQAQQKVEEFIEENGGLPEDAYLEKIKADKMVNISTGKETILGYTFVYKHSYNDLKINGIGGDAIKVSIDNTGIPYYFRLWRNVVSEDKPFVFAENDNEKKEKLKEIVSKIKENAFIYLKCPKDKWPKITEIRLVYWSDYFKAKQEYMPIAWEVNTDVGVKSYVDLDTGMPMNHE